MNGMAGAYFSREGVWRRSLLDVAILGGAAGLGTAASRSPSRPSRASWHSWS